MYHNQISHELVLHYTHVILLKILYCSRAVGKNGKENMEGLKTIQLSTVVVALMHSTLLDNLSVKGLILAFLVFL